MTYISSKDLKNDPHKEMIRISFHFDSDSLIVYLAKLLQNGGS